MPDTRPSSHPILDPWLLLVALLWGLNAVPMKWLLGVIEPAGTLVFRYVTSAVILGAAAWWLGRKRPAGPEAQGRPWGLMILVGVWVGLQQVIFMYAFDWTSASEGSLIISTAPVWTALIGVLFGLERIAPLNWAGILTALAGVVLVVLGGDNSGPAEPLRVQGDALMVLCALLYGGYMVFIQRPMQRYGSMRVNSWVFTFGCLVVLPAGWTQFTHGNWGAFDLRLWAAMFYWAFIAGAFGFVVWYRALARTSPAKTAVYQYLVPVIAMVAAAVWLDERLTALQIAGSAVVILGLILARKPAPAPL